MTENQKEQGKDKLTEKELDRASGGAHGTHDASAVPPAPVPLLLISK